MPEDLIVSIKKLRQESGAGVMECKKALEEKGTYEAALAHLREQGLDKAAKKEGRETAEGLIEAYLHPNGKIGSLVVVTCETDFVARTPEFRKLSHELAMQVAATDPDSVESLLDQEYIRDPGIKVRDLIIGAVAKLGENINLRDMMRFVIE